MSPGQPGVAVSIASTFGKPLAFYGIGRPGGEPTNCPDCSMPADPLFGDHGGDCLDYLHNVPPNSALGIVLHHAQRNRHFSSNDLRAAFDAADIAGPKRGTAFGEAVRRQWIERDGSEKSTDGPTKGHHVAHYQSLKYRPLTAAQRAKEQSA